MSVNSTHQRLTDDLPFFAKHAPLFIKPKTSFGLEGALIPWRFNTPQKWMHHKMEEQRKATGGWVRAALLKGRQQGGSTYTNGRFFHRTVRRPGTSTAIISHEGASTNKLFKMIERYYDNMHPEMRPDVGRDNQRQLTFPGIHSDYGAYTAGNKEAGRSGTAQLIHGSEVAYWPNDYAIQDSALQSIALLPGTEIVLESTGNGPKGLFYDKVMLAIRKVGDYILIFIPWYWQDEYERDPGPGFELDAEEREYWKIHFPDGQKFPFETHVLDPRRLLRKMAWRRAMIRDLATNNGGLNLAVGLVKFKRIYPSFPQEPFQLAGLGMIRADALDAARRNFSLRDDDGALVMGVDPALDSTASDRTVIALRRGRVLEEVIVYDRMRPMQLAGIVAKLVDERHVDMVFFDNAYGTGPVDRLQEMGYARRVQGVWFNEGALEPDRYRNKRTEMIMNTAAWVNEGNVRIPDDDDVIADLAAMPLDEEDANHVHYVRSKREIKKDLGRSPDIYDAIALTFAYPVRRDLPGAPQRIRRVHGDDPAVQRIKRGGGPLSTMRKKREGR